jgi:hypothetical protein
MPLLEKYIVQIEYILNYFAKNLFREDIVKNKFNYENVFIKKNCTFTF